MRFTRWVVLAIFLVAAGCRTEPDPPPKSITAELGTAFTLAPGSTAHLDDNRLAIVFREVSADSRCPEDVACVWEGDATVEVTVTAGNGESQHKLHTSSGSIRAVTTDGYRIELISLQPLRRHDQEISADAYRAELLATRL